MASRTARLNLALTLFSAFLGCNAQPGGSGGTGSVGATLSQPEETDIPEGIYLGEITWQNVVTVNGEVEQDETSTEAYSEIVDEHGLPLIQPSGDVPVEGLFLTRSEALGRSTIRIESVNASGNRLVIGFTQTLSIEGIDLSGTGTWIYEYRPPDILSFIDQRSLTSEVVNGNVVSVATTGNASLSSGATPATDSSESNGFDSPASTWFDLEDPQTGTVCGLVNAENVRLVISAVDSRLILVSDVDRVLTNTLVTDETEVLIDGEVVGFVEFATDQRGRRRVFWVTTIGSLYRLAPDGEPIATETFPEEVNGDCDPCIELWDNKADCILFPKR